MRFFDRLKLSRQKISQVSQNQQIEEIGQKNVQSRGLVETRHFVDYLLKNEISVYGLTTGFADLRDTCVSASEAAQLSRNIIESHDAAIGDVLPSDVVRGAMITRANSLSKGNSGVQLTYPNLKAQLTFAGKASLPFAILAMNQNEIVVKNLYAGEHGSSAQTSFDNPDAAVAFTIQQLKV